MKWGTRKFNQKILIILAICLLGFSIYISISSFSFWIVPFAFIFGIYLFSFIYLVEWGLLRRYRRRNPELPIGPIHWNDSPTVIYIVLAILISVTLAREGLFAPTLTYNFSWYTSERNTNTSSNSTSHSTNTDGENLRLAGRYVDCSLSCSPSGTLCDAFEKTFNCDNDHPDRERIEPVAYVTGQVTFTDAPFCYTPLFKDGQLTIQATLNISASTSSASVSHSLQFTSEVEQSMSGIGSCFIFKQLLGVEAANITASQVTKILSSN